MTLPPLPQFVPSAIGPVAIVYVEDLLTRDGEPAMGLWCPEEREIRLRSGMHLVAQWHTLEHERGHLILWDAGAQMPYRMEEHVCDAFATARVAEMLG